MITNVIKKLRAFLQIYSSRWGFCQKKLFQGVGFWPNNSVAPGSAQDGGGYRSRWYLRYMELNSKSSKSKVYLNYNCAAEIKWIGTALFMINKNLTETTRCKIFLNIKSKIFWTEQNRLLTNTSKPTVRGTSVFLKISSSFRYFP